MTSYYGITLADTLNFAQTVIYIYIYACVSLWMHERVKEKPAFSTLFQKDMHRHNKHLLKTLYIMS